MRKKLHFRKKSRSYMTYMDFTFPLSPVRMWSEKLKNVTDMAWSVNVSSQTWGAVPPWQEDEEFRDWHESDDDMGQSVAKREAKMETETADSLIEDRYLLGWYIPNVKNNSDDSRDIALSIPMLILSPTQKLWQKPAHRTGQSSRHWLPLVTDTWLEIMLELPFLLLP